MFNPFKSLRSKPACSAVVALTILLSGCASVAPPSTLPQAVARHGTGAQPTPAASAAGVTVGVPSRAWWRELGDERLNALVEMAMSRNHDLQAVLTDVRQARALAGLTGREALPQGSLSAQLQRVHPSTAEADLYRQGLPRPPAQTLATLGQMVSWEIDLFGRTGTAHAVAERQLDAAQAGAHAATALLQAEVVRQYVRLRLQQQEAAHLAAMLDTLQQRRDRMQARVDAGLADRREVLAIDAQAAEVRAEQAQKAAGVEVATNALSVLVGRSPVQMDPEWSRLTAAAELPAVPASARLAQPDKLLANRPDVAKADALLRASLGDVVLAERAHLPRLSLGLSLGLNAAAGALGNADALRYAAGPVLQWDWLSMGRNEARAAAARAGSERAWHATEQAVLKALEDSEGALRGWVAAQQALEQSRAAERSAQAAAVHAEQRARVGLEPAVQALDQRLTQRRAQRGALIAQVGALESFAQVQLALAAWQPETP